MFGVNSWLLFFFLKSRLIDRIMDLCLTHFYAIRFPAVCKTSVSSPPFKSLNLAVARVPSKEHQASVFLFFFISPLRF